MKPNSTLSPREASIRLGCGMKRIYELLYSQKLRAAKVKGRWAIPASEIESRLKQREGRSNG